MIKALTNMFPKRIPADRLSAAEESLSGLRARAATAASRRADAERRLAEARASLDAAAESGEDMTPIAQRAIAAEADLKAVDLEAGPLAAAVGRAERALADLQEENRLAVLDAEADSIREELADVEKKALEAMRTLTDLVDRAVGLGRAIDLVYYERDGRQHHSDSSLTFFDVTWRNKLREASEGRPRFILPEARDEKVWQSRKIELEMVITDPGLAGRFVREKRKERPAA